MKDGAVLVTFGGGSPRYRHTARRLGRQARASHWFEEVVVVTDRTLESFVPGFWSRHGDFVRRHSRGFGLWLWKPLLIRAVLQRESARTIVYIDSGSELNVNNCSRGSFYNYLESANDIGVHVFDVEGDWTDRMYTKRDTLEHVGLDDANTDERMRQANVLFLRNSAEVLGLVSEWCDLAILDGYRFLDDSPSSAPESPHFVEHRHDQSLLSCLTKRANIPSAPNETYFGPDWQSGARYPIWTLRNKRIFSKQSRSPAARVETYLADLRLKVKSRA